MTTKPNAEYFDGRSAHSHLAVVTFDGKNLVIAREGEADVIWRIGEVELVTSIQPDVTSPDSMYMESEPKEGFIEEKYSTSSLATALTSYNSASFEVSRNCIIVSLVKADTPANAAESAARCKSARVLYIAPMSIVRAVKAIKTGIITRTSTPTTPRRCSGWTLLCLPGWVVRASSMRPRCGSILIRCLFTSTFPPSHWPDMTPGAPGSPVGARHRRPQIYTLLAYNSSGGQPNEASAWLEKPEADASIYNAYSACRG